MDKVSKTGEVMIEIKKRNNVVVAQPANRYAPNSALLCVSMKRAFFIRL